jgi:ADP-ribose pyrophosphatase YjhB (NUDIX family)
VIGGAVQFAGLFSGRYGRSEGANVLTVDGGGRLLVVRTTYFAHEWTLPGGRVERNEPPHEAAMREAREETGIIVRVVRLVLVDARYASGVNFIFAAEAVGGVLEPQFGEIAEVGWLDRDEIARTSPALEQLLRLMARAGTAVPYVGLDVVPS